MTQEGFDSLRALTDSRYRLSIIVARRAAQLKMGLPPLLDRSETPQTRNTVSIAMKELELGKPIRFGTKKDLPTTEEVKKILDRERREAKEKATSGYTVSVNKK